MDFDKKELDCCPHFNSELLEAMCGNVAVIEQLATCELGSVKDYTEDGAPVRRRKSSVKGAQSDMPRPVRRGPTLAATAGAPPIIPQSDDAYEARGWREAAASALTRFMFLPHSR